MRALHLVYLRGPGDRKLRYYPNYPTEFDPLIIPWWFSSSDREIILAFYQKVLGDVPLLRVEIDWYSELSSLDRAYLQYIAERQHPNDYLVDLHVHHPHVDLREVLMHPDLRPFRHVAITCDHSLINENFGQMSEMAGFVSLIAEELYEEMAPEFDLRDDGPELLRPIVQTLLNPVVVLEAYNALIDAQFGCVASSEQRDVVCRRILQRLVETVPPREMVALSALALRGREGFDLTIGETDRPSVLMSLQSRLLLRDNRLTRWAQWLQRPEMRVVLAEAINDRHLTWRELPPGIRRVRRWLKHSEQLSLDEEFDQIEEWLETGRLTEMRRALEAFDSSYKIGQLPDWCTISYYDLACRLREAEDHARDQ